MTSKKIHYNYFDFSKFVQRDVYSFLFNLGVDQFEISYYDPELEKMFMSVNTEKKNDSQGMVLIVRSSPESQEIIRKNFDWLPLWLVTELRLVIKGGISAKIDHVGGVQIENLNPLQVAAILELLKKPADILLDEHDDTVFVRVKEDE